MSKIPEVRIYFADLLYEGESRRLAGGHQLIPYEECVDMTKKYSEEWADYGRKILAALQDTLGVNYYLPVVDVACAPCFNPKSDPLLMSFIYEPEQFVDILTHELCHVLLGDNNRVQYKGKSLPSLDLVQIWRDLFGDEHDFLALVHIPVQALSKYIYLDILKEPARLERDIENVKKYKGTGPAYTAAWQYVNDHDYKDIIRQLKESYEAVK